MKAQKRSTNHRPDSSAKFMRALARKKSERYILRLYVVGSTPRSVRAITNIRKLCEEHLPGRYTLEVIDAYQQPELLKGKQIIVAPTLIKELPLPLRKFIGDLSNKENLLAGLELKKESS